MKHVILHLYLLIFQIHLENPHRHCLLLNFNLHFLGDFTDVLICILLTVNYVLNVKINNEVHIRVLDVFHVKVFDVFHIRVLDVFLHVKVHYDEDVQIYDNLLAHDTFIRIQSF